MRTKTCAVDFNQAWTMEGRKPAGTLFEAAAVVMIAIVAVAVGCCMLIVLNASLLQSAVGESGQWVQVHDPNQHQRANNASS